MFLEGAMKESINSHVKKSLAELSGVPWNELYDYIKIREIIDSLDWLDLVFDLEHEFGINLKPNDIGKGITIGSLNDLIESKVVEKQSVQN